MKTVRVHKWGDLDDWMNNKIANKQIKRKCLTLSKSLNTNIFFSLINWFFIQRNKFPLHSLIISHLHTNICIWINFYLIINILYYKGRSWRSGTRCDCKTDWLWVRSPPEEMEYLLKFIFPFLRSGVEVKRGVEFCHSTRNASRIRQRVGNRVS